MIDQTDTLEQLLRSAIRAIVTVTISDYSPAEQTCTATLAVPDVRFGDDEERQRVPPVPIPGCPVLWPEGWTRGIPDGTIGLGLVRSSSHDEIDNGQTVPDVPASARTHDLSDLVVLAAYRTPGDGDGRSDGQPRIKVPSGEVLHIGIATATKALALAEKVDARLTAIANDFNAHTHLSVAPGSPNGLASASIPPITMGPFDPVSCDRVKVDS